MAALWYRMSHFWAVKFIGGDLSINGHLAAIYRQSWDNFRTVNGFF